MQARILGADVTYKLGAPGRHVVRNSLAVLAAARLPAPTWRSRRWRLANLTPPTGGRGERIELELPGGTALLIDESYNANPASMRAALALLGQAPVGARGRRIAVLGEMLELGAQRRGAASRPGRADRGRFASISCSARARSTSSLWEALPSERRGGYAVTAAALEADVLGALQRGRRGDGQGLARLEDGPDRQGAHPSVSVARRRRSGVRSGLIRCSTGWPTFPARCRSSTCSAISPCGRRAR